MCMILKANLESVAAERLALEEENYYNKFLIANNEVTTCKFSTITFKIEMLRNEVEKLLQQNMDNLKKQKSVQEHQN